METIKKNQTAKFEVAETQRKMAATRKISHGDLENKILDAGITIKPEKLSYKAWQKNYGKRIGKRSLGMLVKILRRKAANDGGEVIKFNTRTTVLSQSCQFGDKKKKARDEYSHDCQSSGIEVERILYSAFLVIIVYDNKLNKCQVQNA